MNPFTDHYPSGFRRQHPYGNLQPLPGTVNDRHRALSSRRSAKDLNGSTVERMERIEDLDFSVFCTQGIVGVGVFIPMSTVSSLPAGSRSTILDGFDPALASCFPARCCVACFVASSSPASSRLPAPATPLLRATLAPLAQPKTLRLLAKTTVPKELGGLLPNHPSVAPSMYSSYLGRYTHRVAISNHRLISLADGQVTFRWRDSAHHNEQKVMSLSLDEFLRRFLLHLLPKGFVRIRHFGFLANRRRATLLPLCRQALAVLQPQTQPQASTVKETRPLWLCPNCGAPMVVIERLTAAQLQLRSPPSLSGVAA